MIGALGLADRASVLLQPAGGEALDDLPLEDDEEEQHRRYGDHGAGHLHVVLVREAALQQCLTNTTNDLTNLRGGILWMW